MIPHAEYSHFRDITTATDILIRHERYAAVEYTFLIGHLWCKKQLRTNDPPNHYYLQLVATIPKFFMLGVHLEARE